MLSVEEARERVLAAIGVLDPVEMRVVDATGEVTAEDLFAPHALPRFDNSAMDGYAVIGAELAGATEEDPVRLEIIGEVRAGDPGDLQVVSGGAARIMTGAPLPPGSDAVIPVESTSEEGDHVICRSPAPSGNHVRPAGDDLKEGDLLVGAGTELGPGEVALLASMGLSPVRVRPRPRVAILVTGDELVSPESEPAPGQIRDSNSVALRALVEAAGGDPLAHPPVPDDRAATIEAFRRAGRSADLVVSSGGVAVGRYDFVKDVIEELGHIALWRVAMQPGKPVVLGSIGDTPFLGLPGNPVSIHIGFEQFVRPAIRKMRGCRTLLRPTVDALLTDPVNKRPGRLHFVRVRLHYDHETGAFMATPTGPQGSHIQSSLIECDGTARFDVDATELKAGDRVTVEVWRLPSDG